MASACSSTAGERTGHVCCLGGSRGCLSAPAPRSPGSNEPIMQVVSCLYSLRWRRPRRPRQLLPMAKTSAILGERGEGDDGGKATVGSTALAAGVVVLLVLCVCFCRTSVNGLLALDTSRISERSNFFGGEFPALSSHRSYSGSSRHRDGGSDGRGTTRRELQQQHHRRQYRGKRQHQDRHRERRGAYAPSSPEESAPSSGAAVMAFASPTEETSVLEGAPTVGAATAAAELNAASGSGVIAARIPGQSTRLLAESDAASSVAGVWNEVARAPEGESLPHGAAAAVAVSSAGGAAEDAGVGARAGINEGEEEREEEQVGTRRRFDVESDLYLDRAEDNGGLGQGAGISGGVEATQRRSLPTETIYSKKKFSYGDDSKRCFALDGDDTERCHANVYFFGVSKCGTTSLAHWMAKHPQMRWVARPGKTPGAEAHVLDNWELSQHSYDLSAPEAAESDPVIDYTPHYSILAHVPYRIRLEYGKLATSGSVKYIVILREPTARTISSWQFKYDWEDDTVEKDRGKSERRSLAEVFEEGKRRVDALLECRSTHLHPEKQDNPHLDNRKITEIDLNTCNPRRFLESNTYFSHVGKSVYFLQLERWMGLLGRKNFKVVFLEEMAVDPLGTLSSVFDFLGMDLLDEEGRKGLPTREEWEKAVEMTHNQTDEEKKKLLDEQVTPEIVQEMREFFAPLNVRLETLLRRPLPESWSK